MRVVRVSFRLVITIGAAFKGSSSRAFRRQDNTGFMYGATVAKVTRWKPTAEVAAAAVPVWRVVRIVSHTWKAVGHLSSNRPALVARARASSTTVPGRSLDAWH